MLLLLLDSTRIVLAFDVKGGKEEDPSRLCCSFNHQSSSHSVDSQINAHVDVNVNVNVCMPYVYYPQPDL